MNYIIIYSLIILLIIILIICIKYNTKKLILESFSNNSDSYLFPIKGLQSICAKENLKPSYMPKVCYIDGKINSYANCKCEDESGNCKICYDTIKKDSNTSNIVYDASFS